MKSSRPSFVEALGRCLRLRCPDCGRASIALRPFQIRHHCPSCEALFKREDGFFVGAIAVNVVTTEAAVLFAYLLSMFLLGLDYRLVLNLLFALALLFPLAFYHHSWSVWLTLDHLVETLPKLPKGSPPRA